SSNTVRRYISVVSISPWAVTETFLPTVMLRARATTVRNPRRPSLACVRRQPFDGPAAAGTPIAQPVMQPVLPGLPELDPVGHDQVPAPEVGHGDLGPLRPPRGQFRHPVVKLGAGREDRRLPRRPRADLGQPGPRVIVRLSLFLAQLPCHALHRHLAAETVPGEQGAAARVGREVAPLAGCRS